MTGVFLLLTAAFGGLKTAPAAHLDQLGVGEPHTSEQATVTVERVALVDWVDGLVEEPSNRRWLVLVTTITNLTNGPLPTDIGGVVAADGFRENFSIDVGAENGGSHAGVGANDGEVSGAFEITTDDLSKVWRTDDGTESPMMQPNVPGRVAFVFEINSGPAKAIAAGAPVIVTIYDLSFGKYSLINRDDLLWGNPVAAAQVELTPEVLGPVSVDVFDGEASR